MLKISDISILADDLTGACDVAACFAKVVGPVEVSVLPDAEFRTHKGLCVINTQSRLLSAKNSKALIRSVGERLTNKPVIFKKIDAALRGPIGAELEGLIDAIGPVKIVVAPAIPSIGRTTRHGLQYDNGIPIDKTVYAKDPASPIHSADIVEIIKETGNVKCKVYDAKTDDDLCKVVDESLNGSKTVFVGTLGLFNVLADRIERISYNKEKNLVRGQPFQRSRSFSSVSYEPKGSTPESFRNANLLQNLISHQPMIVCGSQYERAHEQIEFAVSHIKANVINVYPMDESNEKLKQLKNGIIPIVCIVQEPIESKSEIIPRFTKMVSSMIKGFNSDGLGIVGGETAYHLLRQLKVNYLKIYGNMSDVIACGSIVDGEMSGCPLTTKGGSTGPDDSLLQMVNYLRGKNK